MGYYVSLFTVWDLWNKGEASEITDDLMDAETYEESEVMKYIHIGLLCVQENASDRVDMSVVVFMLGHNAIDLPPPKHPPFMARRKRESNDCGGSGTLLRRENSTSVNEVTLTTVYGR